MAGFKVQAFGNQLQQVVVNLVHVFRAHNVWIALERSHKV